MHVNYKKMTWLRHENALLKNMISVFKKKEKYKQFNILSFSRRRSLVTLHPVINGQMLV